MRRRSKIDWDFFLHVVRMGVSINSAADLMGVSSHSVFAKGRREPMFRNDLDKALNVGRACLHASPFFFVDPVNYQLVLGPDFDPIPRQPPHGLRSWVQEQLARPHPLELSD